MLEKALRCLMEFSSMERGLTDTTPPSYLMALSMKPFKLIQVMFFQHWYGKCVKPFAFFLYLFLFSQKFCFPRHTGLYFLLGSYCVSGHQLMPEFLFLFNVFSLVILLELGSHFSQSTSDILFCLIFMPTKFKSLSFIGFQWPILANLVLLIKLLVSVWDCRGL